MTSTQGSAEDTRIRLTRDELNATIEKIAKVNARAVKQGWTGRVGIEHELGIGLHAGHGKLSHWHGDLLRLDLERCIL